VEKNSPADGRVQEGDAIISINSYDATQLTHMQARQMITQSGNTLQLTLRK
jgi:C-terminal processing protease CtpA/Prc